MEQPKEPRGWKKRWEKAVWVMWRKKQANFTEKDHQTSPSRHLAPH